MLAWIFEITLAKACRPGALLCHNYLVLRALPSYGKIKNVGYPSNLDIFSNDQLILRISKWHIWCSHFTAFHSWNIWSAEESLNLTLLQGNSYNVGFGTCSGKIVPSPHWSKWVPVHLMKSIPVSWDFMFLFRSLPCQVHICNKWNLLAL